MLHDARPTTPAVTDESSVASSPAAGAGPRTTAATGAPGVAPAASVGGLLPPATATGAPPPATPPTAATDDDPFALHLAAHTVPAVVSARVDRAVARAATDPAGAHGELLAVYQDAAFPQMPAFTRARVMVDLAASFHGLSDRDSARLHYEAALASGVLDAYQQERALEGLRLARGGAATSGAATSGGAAPDAAQVAALEARVDAAVRQASAERKQGPELMHAIYADPAFPHINPRVRARVLFDYAAALQRAHRDVEAVSAWEEALGSGLLDASHTVRARNALHSLRADHAATPRTPEMLVAMIDGAVALQPNWAAARDILLRVYRNPGFAALDVHQRGRTLYDLARSYQLAGDARSARNFWLEALNSGGLDESHRERANRHLRGAMPASTPTPPGPTHAAAASAPEAERESGVPEARREVAGDPQA